MLPPPLAYPQLLRLVYTRAEIEAMSVLITNGLPRLIGTNTRHHFYMDYPAENMQLWGTFTSSRETPELYTRDVHNSGKAYLGIWPQRLPDTPAAQQLVHWANQVVEDCKTAHRLLEICQKFQTTFRTIPQMLEAWPDFEHVLMLSDSWREKKDRIMPKRKLRHLPANQSEEMQHVATLLAGIHMLPDSTPPMPYTARYAEHIY